MRLYAGVVLGAFLVGLATSPAASASPAPPGAPLALLALPAGNSAILSWQPPFEDGGAPVLEYRIYRAELNTAGPAVLVGVSADNTYLDTLETVPSALAAYEYHVTAVNVAGEGAFSSPAALVMSSCIDIVLPPDPPGVEIDPACFVPLSRPPTSMDWCRFIEARPNC